MIITISGKAGSGKSTAAEALAKKLKYKYYSIGNLQRDFAAKKGITLDELRKLEEKDKSIDRQFDDFQKELGKKEDNFVIESRLSPFFIKDSFKVFLECEDEIRYNRIVKDKRKRRMVEQQDKNEILTRDGKDRDRLVRFYGFDFLDQKNYDFVLDTSYLSPDEVVDVILKKVKTK